MLCKKTALGELFYLAVCFYGRCSLKCWQKVVLFELNVAKQKMLLMYQKGAIHIVDFGDESFTGYCVAGPHPSVIWKKIDNFRFIVIPFTSQNTDKLYKSELLFLAGEGNLERDSKLQVSQFQNISVNKIKKYIGKTPDIQLSSIDDLYKKVVL